MKAEEEEESSSHTAAAKRIKKRIQGAVLSI
jgi:hypothetical protein